MPQNYRFVFFGTPKLSVHVLNALETKGLVPALVVTAPDKKAGRGQKLTPSPVKEWALEHSIDVLTPDNLKDPSLLGTLENTEWDFFVVAAYAKILPKVILDIPRKGILNVHPSLLPKFRGPSPVLSAVLADERATGVSIMLLEEKMDTGPVLAQASIEIEKDDWPMRGSVLEDLLFTEGGNLLAETIPQWMEGKVTPEVQDESKATYTRKFSDEDAKVGLGGDAYQNLLKIRTFDKNPRAYFLDKNEKRVIVTDARIENGKLILLRVTPEGKKEMDFSVFEKSQK